MEAGGSGAGIIPAMSEATPPPQPSEPDPLPPQEASTEEGGVAPRKNGKKRKRRRKHSFRRQLQEMVAAPMGITEPGEQGSPVARTVGAAAGIEHHELSHLPSSDVAVPITVIDYAPDRAEFRVVEDIEDFIIQHRPDWVAVRWINIDSLANLDVIRALAEKYDLHPLAIEDLLHVPQRPKVDFYHARGDIHARVFVIARMLQMVDAEGNDTTSPGGHLEGEQISIFLGQKTVVTFQERPGRDVFDPIRQRIRNKGSRVRANDASFLAYSLIDAIVDHCFPILEYYSDRLEELEDAVLERPEKGVIRRIHGIKRELLLLRRAVWPMREVINTLIREPHEYISETTRTYFRDVYDHAVQIIDMVETYREFANGLTETYMSALSNKMNEIMKVLTLITTIFVPLTFLAGVYGMNFDVLPELHVWWAYPAFWGVCLTMAAGMLIWFRRRGWL